MKKFLIILVAALMLALPVLGEGAATLTKVYEVGYGDIVGATNLVQNRARGLAMAGLMKADGTVLFPEEYYNFESNNLYGYLTASKLDDLNGIGLVNDQGQTIIPFEYGEIDVLDEHFALAMKLKESTADQYDYRALFGGYGSGYYLVETNDIYSLPEGKLLASLPREAVEQIRPYPGFLFIEDKSGALKAYDSDFNDIGTPGEIYYPFTFEQVGEQWEVRRATDGQVLFTTPYRVTEYSADDQSFQIASPEYLRGRLNLQGELLVPAEYNNLYTQDGGYYRAKKDQDGKFGLLDATGTPITEFKYDDILTQYIRGASVGPQTYIFAGDHAVVELDGKLGFINKQGQETLAPTYARSAVEVNGSTLKIAMPDGSLQLVAGDGVVTDLPYTSASRLYNDKSGKLYSVVDAAGLVGVIDWHGNVVLPLGNYSEYSVATSTDGSLLVAQNKDSGMTEVYAVTW